MPVRKSTHFYKREAFRIKRLGPFRVRDFWPCLSFFSDRGTWKCRKSRNRNIVLKILAHGRRCSLSHELYLYMELPCMNSLQMRRTSSASSGTISGSPSWPFLYPRNWLYGMLTLPSEKRFRWPQVTFSEMDRLSSCARELIMVISSCLRVSCRNFSNS